jgi:hypothetical protein
MPFLLGDQKALHLQVRQVMPNRDGVNSNGRCKLGDRAPRLAEKRLKDAIACAFHGLVPAFHGWRLDAG